MFSEIIVEMRTDLHAGPIIPLFLLSRKDDSEREPSSFSELSRRFSSLIVSGSLEKGLWLKTSTLSVNLKIRNL